METYIWLVGYRVYFAMWNREIELYYIGEFHGILPVEGPVEPKV